MLFTAVLIPAPEGGFTAFNPETGATSQGETADEALANLREATELYLDEFPVEPIGHPRGDHVRGAAACLSFRTFRVRKQSRFFNIWDSPLLADEEATSSFDVAEPAVWCPCTAS